MSKRAFVITIISMLVSVCELKGQSEGVNIWDVTGNYLIKNRERDKGWPKYPSNAEDVITGPFYLHDLIQTIDIDDPDYTIPVMDCLKSYSFSTFSPHAPYHLLFVKNGNYRIISTMTTLWFSSAEEAREYHNVHQDDPPYILKTLTYCIDVCKELGLTENESAYLFEQVLKYYKINNDRFSPQ